MAGPKKQTPAPIDRPLSRAYLREFSGLSTAYPPGLSDPTSLRVMENLLINRDGSLRVRPGLRHLSWAQLPAEGVPGRGIGQAVIGSHEAFYLNDGSKAYLFAVREDDQTVGFRVLKFDDVGATVVPITSVFTIAQGAAVVAFTAKTQYVKYLQIDNKIFALSDAGETMRLFTVGESKTAKKLSSIETPDWTVEDKLTVIQPEAAWIPGGVVATRYNMLSNPSFETNVSNWVPSGFTSVTRSSATSRDGENSMRLESKPERYNLIPAPLINMAYGIPGYSGTISEGNECVVSNSGAGLKMERGGLVDPSKYIYANIPFARVEPGKNYKFAHKILAIPGLSSLRIRRRWFNGYGAVIGTYTDITLATTGGVQTGQNIGTAPAGAAYCSLQYQLKGATNFNITVKDLQISESNDLAGPFDGDSGTHYFWTGTPGNSESVYHPPQDVFVESGRELVPSLAHVSASVYFRAGSTPRNCYVQLRQYDGSDVLDDFDNSTGAPDATATWNRETVDVPAVREGYCRVSTLAVIQAVPRGEVHYIDSAMMVLNTMTSFFDGDSDGTVTVDYTWSGTPHGSPSLESTFAGPQTVPTPETKTANTLISTNVADHENNYNFGFFYTFNNEVGESAASQVTVLRAQRAWGQWKWELPNGGGEPDPAAPTLYPDLAADQLVAIMPPSVFTEAVAQGALNWSLYMLTWSNQDNVPIEAIKVATTELTPTSTYDQKGWARVTPQTTVSTESAIVPSELGRYNYSNPSSGGNGLVAADRMVLVKDPTAAAVIKWTSNSQGSYTDFTATKGGGYKTLTSGNLYVPACVKLWQNPQSVDTLTILCLGTDGMSAGYYMSPATVTSQSETVQIMGFEETTATPGTTSPYGCEVFNNALYHPLDEQLMKSTASNYNINHKSLTDQIEFDWLALRDKEWIISSQHENRLYFLVNNPKGEQLEPGHTGNELWVYDAASDTGTWSRWLVQGNSLRKIEQGDRIYMSLTRNDGIFYFDPALSLDDVVLDDDDHTVSSATIAWKMETNVQGANRAHDAWAHLQQMELVLGNWQGSIEWGLRSWDLNGKPVNVSKIKRDLGPPSDDGLPWDVQDRLLVRRGLQEWYFYAHSVDDGTGVPLPSSGQINSVQYRYAPLTVNDGYERGSVETFEYGRETAVYGSTTTDAGVPQPFTDTRRP